MYWRRLRTEATMEGMAASNPNPETHPAGRPSRALLKWLAIYLVLHLLTVLVFFWVTSGIVRNQMLGETEKRMNDIAVQLVQHIQRSEQGLEDPRLPELLQTLGEKTDVRYTLVDSNGTVVCDSETGTADIGPHEDRPEIIQAVASGSGFSRRYSDTLKTELMYHALAIDDEDSSEGTDVVRIAVSVQSVTDAIRSRRNLILLFSLLLGGLSAGLMTLFSIRALAPLSEFAEAARRIGEGDYTNPLSAGPGENRDEWETVRRSLRTMQKDLQSREERLTENSRQLEAVLSSMSEGVLATDSAGTVILANLAVCRMLSISRDELIGQDLASMVRVPELQTAVQQARETRAFARTEFQTLSEPRRTLSGRINVMDNSPESGVAIVLNDVSELRQLETMRRDFVSNVSHELKTPLSAIKAYAETLKLGAIHDSDNNMQFVEQIESNADLLNLQIQDLIALGRVESGHAAFDISSVNINDVCHACFERFDEIARKQSISLTVQYAEETPIVRADEEAVTTIVNNLVSNAIQYTPAGGNVLIKTSIDDWDATVQVVDDGIGIGAEDSARIFERFYRVDKARSRDMGGTGLGLSIVKHLVQEFDGSIDVSSDIGKGSTFSVKLPLIDAE
ncbi:MAG: ATP-binding protein [Planctomycetota bacterium]